MLFSEQRRDKDRNTYRFCSVCIWHLQPWLSGHTHLHLISVVSRLTHAEEQSRYTLTPDIELIIHKRSHMNPWMARTSSPDGSSLCSEVSDCQTMNFLQSLRVNEHGVFYVNFQIMSLMPKEFLCLIRQQSSVCCVCSCLVMWWSRKSSWLMSSSPPHLSWKIMFNLGCHCLNYT